LRVLVVFTYVVLQAFHTKINLETSQAGVANIGANQQLAFA